MSKAATERKNPARMMAITLGPVRAVPRTPTRPKRIAPRISATLKQSDTAPAVTTAELGCVGVATGRYISFLVVDGGAEFHGRVCASMVECPHGGLGSKASLKVFTLAQ